jgi:protein archease
MKVVSSFLTMDFHMKKDFQVIDHTADLKIRVFGSSKKELFRNALIGMFQSIGPQSSTCTYQNNRIVCPELPITHQIRLTSLDCNVLLIDFLSEALYLSDIYNEAYLDVDIEELSDTSINAIVHGIKVGGFEVVEIKAVTFHDLNIMQINGMWQTDIVFDI